VSRLKSVTTDTAELIAGTGTGALIALLILCTPPAPITGRADEKKPTYGH